MQSVLTSTWTSLRQNPFVLGLFLVLVLGAASAAVAPDRLIGSSGVGPVHLGMTIAAAGKALPGFTLVRSSGAEGVAPVAVRRDGRTMMMLVANENDPAAPVDAAAKIGSIEVIDPGYRTAAGIGPQSPLGEVERAYGRLIRIMRSEIEQREYALFENQPPGLAFRVAGDADGGEAGLYEPGANMTDRARPGARILFITVQRLP